VCRWIKLLRGVDGCAAGWLVVWAEAGSHRVAASLLTTIAELALDDPAALTAIDIPIGLHHNGPRPCDQEARLLLGSRRSSVFPAPVRSVLQARSYNEACELSFQAQGRKLSKQTYNILAKIRAVDALLQAQGSLSQRLVEVHPELSFQQWNNGIPMAHAKKKAEGHHQRLQLVEPRFPGAFAEIRGRYKRREVADDDILDALACLWSAERIASGNHLHVGQPGQIDACGIPMQILA
jgi:predicted RNase H-like nuclease